MFDADPVALLARERLRERTGELVAESCAWSVGLSDVPHHVRRSGRVVPSGLTLGMRAAAGQHLGGDEDERLELGDTVPGSFADTLNALCADGTLLADRFDDEVLAPFVLDTCVQAMARAEQEAPQAWAELLDELGEDGTDPPAVVRAAEWDVPLRTDAEQLVLAALGPAPLVEVEAEGLPLSLVRAAEAETRRAVEGDPVPARAGDDELAGALFLADVALDTAGLARPVAVDDARAALQALLGEGLELEEVLGVLPLLPVLAETADVIARDVQEQLRARP